MLIDLSVRLDRETPVYPGDPQVEIVPAALVEDDGYRDHFVSFPTHAGTHIDSPSHMLADGKDLDEFPLEKFRGRGVCVDARAGFRLSALERASIQEGDIVVFRTGMAARYAEKEYFEEYPDLPQEMAEYLIGKKVKIVGFDSASPDHAPFPIHKLLLQAEVLIIENLADLGALEGRQFNLQVFPLKLALDGAPARIIAETA